MRIFHYEVFMQKRVSTITGLKAIRVRIFALFCGLTVIGIFFGFLGIDPIALYVDIFWVNILLFPNTLGRFITLLLISIGLAIPFKARIDNIGAEGQYVIGTLAAFGTSLYFSFLDPVLLIPLMFINGFIIGAIWALPVVFFRAKGGFQGADVVASFLMVFPAVFLMEYLVSGPWRDRETGFAYSSLIPEINRIPVLGDLKIYIPLLDFHLDFSSISFPMVNIKELFEGLSLGTIQINIDTIRWDFSPVHITIFLAIFLTLIAYYFIFRYVNGIPKTKIGYEINVIGKNPLAGRTAGMSFFKVILFCMIISGGLAGLAGVGEIAGNQFRLGTTSPGYGFTAIAVTYLGGLNPIGILVSALFFSVLSVGGNAIKLTKGLPGTALDVFSGVILFFVLLAEFFFRYTIKWRRV